MVRQFLVVCLLLLVACDVTRSPQIDEPRPESPTFYRNFPASPTSLTRIRLQGLAEPGARVEVYRNGILVERTIATERGEFRTGLFDLKVGDNHITALAEDAQGRRSLHQPHQRRRSDETGRFPRSLFIVRTQ